MTILLPLYVRHLPLKCSNNYKIQVSIPLFCKEFPLIVFLYLAIVKLLWIVLVFSYKNGPL